MRLELAFGKGFLPLELEMHHKVETVTPKSAERIPNTALTIHQNIASHSSFRTCLQENDGEPITLVIDNPQRIVNIQEIITGIIETLGTLNHSSRDVLVLVTFDNPNSKRSTQTVHLLRKALPPAARLKVHDPENDNLLFFAGNEPESNIPVFLSAEYVQSSIKMVVGSIMQSAFTGVAGGPFSISHGLGGGKTRYYLDKAILQYESAPFQIDPQYQSLLYSVLAFAPPDLCLNIVQDFKGTTAHITAGTVEDTTRESKQIARDLSSTPLKKRYDAAIVCAGGSGFDVTLYEACESLYSGFLATRNGGSILLVAECDEGVGPTGFLDALSTTRSEHEIRIMAKNHFKPGM